MDSASQKIEVAECLISLVSDNNITTMTSFPQTTLRGQAGVPESSARLEVDGTQLAVSQEGSGPAVVCLHAIGHGGGDYAAFTAAVCDRYRVIRIDWPGHGRSAPDAGPVTTARYAQLLRGVIVHLDIQRPIIIGCSIGGAAAIRYASEFPVRALVLANSGGLVPITSASRRACLMLAAAFESGARRAWWFKPAFSLFYRSVLPTRAARRQRALIVASVYEIAGQLAAAWKGFADPDADLRERACNLNVPVWLAWASRDKINRFSDVEPTAMRMRLAKVTKFEAGHVAFLECPGQFVEGFVNFANRLPPAT